MSKNVINYAILFAIVQEVSNRIAKNRNMDLDMVKRDMGIFNKLISKTSTVLGDK